MLRLASPLAIASALALPLTLAACDLQERVIDDEFAEGEEAGEEQGEQMEEQGPELCAVEGEARACGEGEGTQFCARQWPTTPGGQSTLEWGLCLTDFECLPGESQDCGLGEEFGNISASCDIDSDGTPYWNWDNCNTPLVLSFEGGPIEMQASSAAFDISGAGVCLSTDWPAAQNPWLAIDLDQNGFIDGGHELFGSGSILADGMHAQNGFLALSELDSNADGVIDGGDERFAEILVWRDEDGDKQSLPWELSDLAAEGVSSIELGYSVDEQCDERGNCGRERASFQFAAGGETRRGEVVDVYLACN